MSGKIQKLFEEQDVNISQMSRKTGIPYGTLYDIAIGKTSFDKIKIGALSKIAHEFGMTVDELIKQVSSPGGTTIAGLDKLYEGKLTDTVNECCKACTARAYELAKK